MADMKEFDVVRIARSDGADTGPGYWPVTAAAAKKTTKDAAPEKMPRTKPQMTRLTEDDPRYVEWRVKLGILLKQELAPTPDGKGIILCLCKGDSPLIQSTQRGIPGMCSFQGVIGYMKSPSISGYLDTPLKPNSSKAHKSLPRTLYGFFHRHRHTEIAAAYTAIC
jgi:hypothetical protein